MTLNCQQRSWIRQHHVHREHESRTLLFTFREDIDYSAIALDNLFADGQTESNDPIRTIELQLLLFIWILSFRPTEKLIKFLDVILVDSFAFVNDVNAQHFPVTIERCFDLNLVARRKFHRVFDQVDKHLFQMRIVSNKLVGQLRLYLLMDEGRILQFGLWGEDAKHEVEYIPRREFFLLWYELALLDLLHIENVCDEAEQEVDSSDD